MNLDKKLEVAQNNVRDVYRNLGDHKLIASYLESAHKDIYHARMQLARVGYDEQED